MTVFVSDEYCTGRGHRFALGAVTLLELFGRLRCGICGPEPLPPRCVIDANWSDLGYCLDAPEVMAAGSCVQDSCDELADEGEPPILLALPTTFNREATP